MSNLLDINYSVYLHLIVPRSVRNFTHITPCMPLFLRDYLFRESCLKYSFCTIVNITYFPPCFFLKLCLGESTIFTFKMIPLCFPLLIEECGWVSRTPNLSPGVSLMHSSVIFDFVVLHFSLDSFCAQSKTFLKLVVGSNVSSEIRELVSE